MLIFLTLLALSILSFILWWEITSQRFWSEKGVPYLRGNPVIGIYGRSILLLKNFSVIFSELHHDAKQKNEPISGFYFFKKPCLLIRDMELIKKILVKDFNSFPCRTLQLDSDANPFANNFIPLIRGDLWKDLKRLFTKSLSTSRVINFFPHVKRICKNLIVKLTKEVPPGNSKEYDALDLASQFANDSTTLCAFGYQTDCLNGKNRDFIDINQQVVSVDFSRFCKFFLYFLSPRLARALGVNLITPKGADKFYENFFNFLYAERKKGFQRDDIFNNFIDMMEKNPEVFSKEVGTTQIMTVFLGGLGASSSLISFALYELSKNPDVQEKLRLSVSELKQKSETMDYDQITSIHYLDKIYKEILRMYSGLMFLDRQFCPDDASKEYSLEPYHGFKIPSGMAVFISVYGINHDPKYFSNPYKFDPERFDCSERNPGINFLLSFGQGPRLCPGHKFTELQFKMFLVYTIQKFRIRECKRTPKKIELSYEPGFLRTKYPIFVNLERIV